MTVVMAERVEAAEACEILRDRARWPQGWRWDFNAVGGLSCPRGCVLGLLAALRRSHHFQNPKRHGDELDIFGVVHFDYYKAKYAEVKAWKDVTPEMVAQAIEDELINQGG